MIEDMLLSNDRLMRLEKEATAEKKLVFSRVDPVITPHSKQAQEKIAAHWAGATPEEIKKSEGEVVNDGDIVRDAEEAKFKGEAAHTEKRLDKEHNVERNSLWEVADQITEDDTMKKTTKKASVDKEAGKMPAAAMEALKKYRAGKGKGKKEDKDDDKEDKKDKKKDKKEDKKDDKKKEKKALSEDELMKRYYNRHKILDSFEKFAAGAMPPGEYGDHVKDVQFDSDWYDEIVGEKTNIGNIRGAGKTSKKANSAEVGLDFDCDPEAEGTPADFKMDEIFEENDVTKDIEGEGKYSGGEDNYSKELGETHSFKAASAESWTKQAHYNNRTQNMSDDGPTAPAEGGENRDPRDFEEADWWENQVKGSEAFYKKEQSILGDGKKETHMDAIPVFKSKATKQAFVNTRKLQREAVLSKVAAAEKAVANEKSYYAEAYGDSGYAALQVKDYDGSMKKKASDELLEQFDPSTIEGRATRRRLLAGVDVLWEKTAQAAAPAPAAGAAAIAPVLEALKRQTAPAADASAKALATKALGEQIKAKAPAAASAAASDLAKAAPKTAELDEDGLEKEAGIIGDTIQGAKGGFKSGILNKLNDPAVVAKLENLAKTNPDIAKRVDEILSGAGFGGAAAPSVAAAPSAAATEAGENLPGATDVDAAIRQASTEYLQMRKEARRTLLAGASYGEPVKEPKGKVGDPDWDASELTRNAIVDSPQPDIIAQLEKSIADVRDAVK